jgi:hypothetical protein
MRRRTRSRADSTSQQPLIPAAAGITAEVLAAQTNVEHVICRRRPGHRLGGAAAARRGGRRGLPPTAAFPMNGTPPAGPRRPGGRRMPQKATISAQITWWTYYAHEDAPLGRHP